MELSAGTVSSKIKFPGTVLTQSQTICCSLEQAEGMGRKRGLFQCAPSHLSLPQQPARGPRGNGSSSFSSKAKGSSAPKEGFIVVCFTQLKTCRHRLAPCCSVQEFFNTAVIYDPPGSV